jgi:hypothetical protein
MEARDICSTLLKNINFLLLQNTDDKNDIGVPNALDTSTLLLYKLLIDNKELFDLEIDNKLLIDYLFDLSKYYSKDYYNDYCCDNNHIGTINDFILNIWMNTTTEMDFYEGNGCYDIYGIIQIKLKKILLLVIENNNI